METGVESNLWRLNKSAELYKDKFYYTSAMHQGNLLQVILWDFLKKNSREIVKYGVGEREKNWQIQF